MPTIIDDIANWVLVDMLHRGSDSDIQSVARNAARDFYKVLCSKVPFDELNFTSQEFPLTRGQAVYTIGNDWALSPTLRALASLRITFDSTNKRRLRRSHVRTYDALSFTTNSRPATYARWGNTIELNPPPDSSAYTVRFRFWGRPPIGHSMVVSGATSTATTMTYTVPANSTVNTDQLIITGMSPTGYNGTFSLTSGGGTTSLVVTSTNNPGTYVGGGIITDTTQTDFQNTILLTPIEWDELLHWETLYRVYNALDQQDKAAALVQPAMMPRQPSPKKTTTFEAGIIPRLWNDLLVTMSQVENTDEDFSINPIIRAYSMR
jgi:hypothetical protein